MLSGSYSPDAMSRTLSVECDAIPLLLGEPALVPVKLSGREALNGLFEYELLLKTPDARNALVGPAADVELDDFIGRSLNCRIERCGPMDRLGPGTKDGVREINALVTSAEVWGEEGRHVQYRLTLRPWLYLATLRTDCRIFQDLTVVQILDAVLAAYPYPVDKLLYGPAGGWDERYPPRDFQTQFNESDFEFFSRLCQEWGINYHFVHLEGRHRLVLSDATAERKADGREGLQDVAFHPPGWKAEAEYLYSAVPVHRITSGAYATRDHDYRQPRDTLAVARRDPRPTAHGELEVYQWHAAVAGSHYAQPDADPQDRRGGGRQLGLLRMEALRTHGRRLKARGAMRGMVPGENFNLHGHPRQAANAQYLIIDTTFVLEDVGQDSQPATAAADRRQGWQAHVELIAHPVDEILRPVATQPKPRCTGPQVATVVGPAGHDLWTDALGRIKVQFPWDRLGREDERSSCWVRVCSPWAGNQLGAIQLPRIGQEVLIDFIGGDPDLPICIGRVHNAWNLPPWKLPSQGALSGLRSRELGGARGNRADGPSNHLLFDDTAGKMQAQLKSDHLCSSLSLGAIARVDDNAGRKDARGAGFELRTDGHGVLRAQEGLLLTTEPRSNAEAHAKDLGETAVRLRTGCDLHAGLAKTAREAEAQGPDDQQAVCTELRKQNDAVQGTGPATPGEYPELNQPHLVLASPSGIASTTEGTTHVASFGHNAFSSGLHTSLAAGKSFLASARRAIRMVAYESVIRLVAARDDIDLAALEANLKLFAMLKVTVDAETISIRATRQLEIGGGGSFTTYDDQGVVTRTPGRAEVHASSHARMGPASGGVEVAAPAANHAGCVEAAQRAAIRQLPLIELP